MLLSARCGWSSGTPIRTRKWNGSGWVPAGRAGAGPKVLLTADLSESLVANPAWSYSLNTDRCGDFTSLAGAQDGAYQYSEPAPTSIVR
jgi:hypothetical protein